MREALGVWRSFYCDGVFVRCERYKLAATGTAVPDELLPNGRLIDPRGGDVASRSGDAVGRKIAAR
jgi:hypothetical protein